MTTSTVAPGERSRSGRARRLAHRASRKTRLQLIERIGDADGHFSC
jgi:hypothetical protein